MLKNIKDYLQYESSDHEQLDLGFYQLKISETDKSKIFTNKEVKDLLEAWGFVEELGEFMLLSGFSNKMNKIKYWLKKAIKKVQLL